jgi:hypothetical protein
LTLVHLLHAVTGVVQFFGEIRHAHSKF